jgi:pyruvate dehydrogenase E2 component (dihydrolipoamide acetyltransferase)
MSDTGADTSTTLFDYTMPSLGSDMDEGTVIEWLVEVGDSIERGQIVARVETEKSDIDIESWRSGVVAEIVVGPGETVPVGAVLMRLRTDPTGDAEPADPDSAAAAPMPRAIEHHGSSPGSADARTRQPRAVLDRDPDASPDVTWATPLARRLAGERGIALSEVTGTGPGGAIRASDLPELAALKTFTDEPSPDRETGEPLSRSERMRKLIGARMVRSNAEIPQYRVGLDINLGPLMDHLAEVNAARPMRERIVPAAALVRAVALTTQLHPEFNGSWTSDGFRPGLGINVSIAISLRTGGLVTPTIRRADEVSLGATMQHLRDFTMAARTGSMRSEWTTSDSSITVTNLGDRGADFVHGLISPPEVALVGFGRIAQRAIVVDGSVVARPVVISTLAADHRATDGAAGSGFLATLADILEHPEKL